MTTISELATAKSGDAAIDALVTDSFTWNWSTASGNTLYYYFAKSDLSATTEVETAMSSSTQASVKSVLAQVTSLTGVQFAEVTSDGSADIHFAMSKLSDASGMCWTTYDWSGSARNITSVTGESYVWLDPDYSNTSVGTYGYQVLLHEVGHAMGLEHPFEDNSYPDAEDSWDYTVMSYSRGSTGIQTVYQENDIEALQWIYGTDGLDGASNVRSGGTTTPTTTTPTTTTTTSTVDASDLVNALLGDSVRQSVTTYYSDLLSKGWSTTDVADQIIDDYNISTSRWSFLNNLYSNIYGRTPTTAERTWFQNNAHSDSPEELVVSLLSVNANSEYTPDLEPAGIAATDANHWLL